MPDKTYLKFEEVPPMNLLSAKTKTWLVRSAVSRNEEVIGVINWNDSWKKYCFRPQIASKYDVNLLLIIADKINQESAMTRTVKVKRKSGRQPKAV